MFFFVPIWCKASRNSTFIFRLSSYLVSLFESRSCMSCMYLFIALLEITSSLFEYSLVIFVVERTRSVFWSIMDLILFLDLMFCFFYFVFCSD